MLLTALLFSMTTPPATAAETNASRGIQFIGFDRCEEFAATNDPASQARVLLSPRVAARIEWTELICSWNTETPPGSGLKFEVRAFSGERPTKFFNLGLWASDATRHPRESVPGQKDADGDVQTDTLVLIQPATEFQLRITLTGTNPAPRLKFLAVSLLDSHAQPSLIPPNRAAWGVTLPVPERSQMAHAGGSAWCSPTTISMLLAFWASKLGRPELDHLTPAVVKEVFDPKWDGTGNWVFNTAFAGSFKGLRACTVRLSDLAEAEAWIAKGIPVGLSVCYNRLRGKSREPSGHLVVLVGFTKEGDPILNDPGTRENVRKTFPRARLLDAWTYSKNAAYLVYPEQAELPEDKFGHWSSPAGQSRLRQSP